MRSKQYLALEHPWAKKLPSGWRYEFFEDLIKDTVDNRGRTVPTSDFGIPLIATNCISNSSLYPIFKDVRHVSQKTYDEWFRDGHVEPNDILFANKGENCGKICLTPNPVNFCFAQDMIGIKVDEKKINFKYLFAILRSRFMKEQLFAFRVDSVIPHLKKTDFDSIIIPIPPKKLENFIGECYFSISEKIENLQNQNKVIEQIAQAIFKSWFIDFDGVTEFEDSELGKIPKGWQIGILENFLDLTKGVSYKSQDLKFSNKALVTLKSVKRGGGYTNIGLKSFDGKYNENQVVKENDIIVAQTDLTQNADVIGKPALIRDSKHFDILVASLDIVIIKIKNNKILKFYIYYLFLTDRFQNHVYGYTSGTTVLHLAKDAIPNFVFILPPTKTLEKFDKLISTWIQKNHENNNQIENLTKIRDFLLPKLMSGEIRV